MQTPEPRWKTETGNPRDEAKTTGLDHVLGRWNVDGLHRLLSKVSPEALRALFQRCPECLSNSLIEKAGELICKCCGLVVEEIPGLDSRLPFDTTYALTGMVAIGRSIGDTLPANQLARVITQNPLNLKEVGLSDEDIEFIRSVASRVEGGERVSKKEAEELVRRYLRKIRLTHLTTHIRNVEPEASMKLKRELTWLLERYGLYEAGVYDEFSHRLADKAGVLAERVGRFMEAGGARPPKSYRRMAGAILVWLMGDTPRLAGTCDEMKRGEGITPLYVDYVDCLTRCPLLLKTSYRGK